MAIQYLKKSPKTSSTDDTKTTGIVQDLLKDIETTKEQGCIDLTKKFDKYDGDIIVSKERIEEIKKTLDQKTKDDVQFSYDRVRKFAEAQLKNYGQDFEVEIVRRIICRTKACSSKHCWLLCTWWKICAYSLCCHECYNCKSSRC
jgi:sulfopropanediol 3-dehydrogenase